MCCFYIFNLKYHELLIRRVFYYGIFLFYTINSVTYYSWYVFTTSNVYDCCRLAIYILEINIIGTRKKKNNNKNNLYHA